MNVVRGGFDVVDRDARATAILLDRCAASGDSVVRVWRPPKHVAFGRRDTTREGYADVREHVSDAGYAVHERAVGGRAVVHTGTTVSIAWIAPADDARFAIPERYDRLRSWIRGAFRGTRAELSEGEPPHSWCPGDHSLMIDGKVCGIAQRVTTDCALTAAIVIVQDVDEIARLSSRIYDGLDLPFDPATVDGVREHDARLSTEAVINQIGSEIRHSDDRVEHITEVIDS
ncbi:lipoate--protein ligase family protein [Halopenitus persicus]|uniref:lipoate--protein ligase family protein n=1 Tax=Halopenitus persicus TaxID=1048396 RepID=UPI000BBB6250|nr:lipoate--protein ligase family protein [Halopenitus persicus]